jgi:predicted DCC family thiol-disulfide oxidoreductase YuxK
MEPKHVILYDRDCGLCKWSLDMILRWDRRARLRGVAIQSPEGERLLSGIDPDRRLDSWHLAGPDGTVTSAGAAAAPLARLLPGGGPLAYLLARFPGATERAYRWVADHRAALARVLRIDSGYEPRSRDRV